MKIPLIIAHGDLRILYGFFVIAGFAIVSGLASVVVAAKKKKGESARFAVIAGIGAIVLGVGSLCLFGWPRDLSDPFALAMVLPVPLGAFGIFVSLFFGNEKA
jgi:hypothetical protein